MPTLTRPAKPDLYYELDDFTDPWRDAPYLILQHGNGRSSRFWYSWVPYLSRHYRVIRPDARGLGRSSADFDVQNDLTLPELIGDLTAVIDELGGGPVHFCGESMGGILGLVLSALHPERVRSLTLVSTPVFINDKMKETYSMGHGSRQEAVKAMGRAAWLKATNRSTRFPPDTDPGLLDWYEAEFAQASVDVQLAMAGLVNSANAKAYLSQVSVPVLGLYPTGGPITDADQEKLLTESLSDFRLVHLPTSFHKVQHVFPRDCAQNLLYFIAQQDGITCGQ